MKFIKVKARPCNSQGIPGSLPEKELILNTDIIGAFSTDGFVYLKAGDLLRLGDSYYTKIRISDPHSFKFDELTK